MKVNAWNISGRFATRWALLGGLASASYPLCSYLMCSHGAAYEWQPAMFDSEQANAEFAARAVPMLAVVNQLHPVTHTDFSDIISASWLLALHWTYPV